MPKLICPNCAKFVTVPDEAAGTTVPCPECQAPFPVPARYDPVVSVPHTSPSPVLPPVTTPPPPPPGLNPETVAPVPPPSPDGYAHTIGVSLKPATLAWVPAVGLSLVLVLTTVPWVGSYVGGSAVYSQSAWRALVGKPDLNYKLEELSQQEAGWPTDLLSKVTSDGFLMFPYVLLLILAVAVAWAERLVVDMSRSRLPAQLAFLANVWPHRVVVLAGVSAALVILLFFQSARGFGLERAMYQVVTERFAPEREKAEGNQTKLGRIDNKEAQELNRFNLERTIWFKLAIGLHLLVVLAMAGRFWLDRRGNKPHPRLVLQY